MELIQERSFCIRVLQFDDKISFLRDVAPLTRGIWYDFSISTLQERNSSYKGRVAWFFELTEKEKDEIIFHAWKAVNAWSGLN